MRCRICGSFDLHPFLDLGSTPLADSFPSDPNAPEVSYPLAIGVCKSCFLVQMLHEVPPTLLFGEDYGFRTGASPSLITHFREYADEITQVFGDQIREDGILEIASNDGTLLGMFETDYKLGIDPVEPAVATANANGIRSKAAFFTKKLAMSLEEKFGIVIANNVLAHVPDLHDFMQGVRAATYETGIFICEFQYFPFLLFNNEFDHIYHEHNCFFSLTPIMKLASIHGFSVFEVQMQKTQGGSLRVFMSREVKKPSEEVEKLLRYEQEIGIDKLDLYGGFQARVNNIRFALRQTLADLKAQGMRIAGYGASAKSNTLLHYCGLTSQDLLFIADTTPQKFGRYTPGTHIPILDQSVVTPPDYYLVLVWNYINGIMKREIEFRKNGGKFIVPIPSVHIL